MSMLHAQAVVRPAGRLRAWLSGRHSLREEAVVVLSMYGLYELARGLVAGDVATAERHARALVALERSQHLFVEASVQHAARAVPGLIGLLGIAYLTLHGGSIAWTIAMDQYAVDLLAADIRGLIGELGAEPALLVGHDWLLGSCG